MLDELRNTTDDDDDSIDFDNDIGMEIVNDNEVKVQKLFLGMTAVERMFISIFLFMNVAILGLAFLLATHRIGRKPRTILEFDAGDIPNHQPVEATVP